ncbi:hypothetical protein CEV31_1041 [Brucella thiophenivorans]|uniref:Uncharacterized protein n=1 Tax=Brucella thiophenivorans TaxID=571255 RepID=A0A256G0Y1_9HYPH|nr:hypothetical protein CEV31_1041 [Brucella thiophenivorans]
MVKLTERKYHDSERIPQSVKRFSDKAHVKKAGEPDEP